MVRLLMRPRCFRLIVLSGFCGVLLFFGACGHSERNDSHDPEAGADSQSLFDTGLSNNPEAILMETPLAPFQTMPMNNCLAHHLQEALELNETRLPLYAKASSERSRPVSEKLLNSERNVLALSKLLDGPARFWQARGVPVGCADFVPMAGAAKFQERIQRPTYPYLGLNQSEVFELVTRVKWAVLQSDDRKVELLHKEIVALADQKDFHCMKRHILESLARSAYLLPIYDEWSANRGLPSPRLVMLTYINSQIATLFLANEIDNLSAPMQAEGIPIVCNDVPFIPYGPLSEEPQR